MELKKLLITGDTGLLGSSLAREAREIYQVFGASRASVEPQADWRHVAADLTDTETTLSCLEEIQPEFIVHCAAMTNVEQCETEPESAEAANVAATEQLARWAAQHGVRLTFVSTDSVFDGLTGGYSEGDAPRPLNNYARTKLAGEQAAKMWCADSLIVRTNFYGWNQKGKPNIGRWMYSALLRNELLMAFTDVRFSPLFADHLARLILELIGCDARGVFHLGSQESCSKYEFALLLSKAFSFGSRQVKPIMLEDFGFVARRPRNTSLSAAKCSRFLGKQMPNLEQGIAAFAKALRADDGVQAGPFQGAGK